MKNIYMSGSGGMPGEAFHKAGYFSARPPSERLTEKKLGRMGVNIMRDWKVCLREYLDDYYADYLKKLSISAYLHNA